MQNQNMQNVELLKKYLDKYQLFGADFDKRVDYREAQTYYQQIVEAITDFNRSDDDITKNAILYTGIVIAMKAIDSFENVIAKYRDEFFENSKNKGHAFELPLELSKVDEEKFYKSKNLADSIRKLTPDMDMWLKKFTVGQTHDTKSDTKYYTDFRDIPITYDGVKIYHLKALVDYCENMSSIIRVFTVTDDKYNYDDLVNVENINNYFSQGSNLLTALNIAYSNKRIEDCDEASINKIFKISRNLLTKFLLAIMLSEVPNLTEYQNLLDLLDSIENNKLIKQNKAINMVIAQRDEIELMVKLIDRPESEFPPRHIIDSWISQILEIGNALKVELLNIVGNDIQKN